MAAAAAIAPAPASAAVQTTGDAIVVSGDGARAVIARAPFRMSFTKSDGSVVLSEVPNELAAPVPSAQVDGEPLGLHNVRPSVYAPLAFEVGGGKNVQQPFALWAGNMLAGGRAGTTFSAQAVKDVEPDGAAGARLTLTTSDPSRTIELHVDPDGEGTMRVRAELSDPSGVSAFGDSFASERKEAFRGFGGRHNALDQHGNDFYNWIEQENLGAGPLKGPFDYLPGSGGSDDYLFPNGPTAAYYAQNQFVSSHGYGLFLNDTSLSRWRLDSDRDNAWQFAAAAARLDYDVAVGDAPDAIRGLTAITGRQRVPPEWAQGPSLYRGVHIANESVDSYRDKVTADVANIAKYHLPVEAYDYEGWHGLDPQFVRATNDRLRGMGIHPLAYLRAFVGNDGGLFDNQQDVDEAVNGGYVAKDPLGRPYAYQEAANQAYVIDFTNPAAVKWWEGRVRAMLDLGFDGFMQDFGEQTQADMRFANGETGETMHNSYPNVYHAVTRAIVDRYMADHPGREVFFFTRAGFSGRPGSAAYENTNFPGDETTDYQRSSGLPSLIPDMLNRGIGGAYGFNTDIGGYLDTYADQTLDLDLFSRWLEASALMPFFRVHNSCCAQGARMPWDFGDAGVDVWRKMAALHVRGRPYMRRLWKDAQRTGLPVTRPLWLEFPGDERAADQDEEFMLGADVLVAPVVSKQASGREVYFPAGCWSAPEGGERVEGPTSRAISAGAERLPYFVRCGTDPFAEAKRACTRRQRWAFRIHQPRRGRIVAVTAYVNGHRVKRVRGRRVTRIVLRLPRKRFKLRIVARAASGQRTISVRRFGPCHKGRPRTTVHRHRQRHRYR